MFYIQQTSTNVQIVCVAVPLVSVFCYSSIMCFKYIIVSYIVYSGSISGSPQQLPSAVGASMQHPTYLAGPGVAMLPYNRKLCPVCEIHNQASVALHATKCQSMGAHNLKAGCILIKLAQNLHYGLPLGLMPVKM